MKEDRNYVFMGGSWYNTPPYVGEAATEEGYPGRAVVNLGFRLAVDTETIGVPRGGSWDAAAVSARVAYRGGLNPSTRSSLLGFRITRETR
jgi:formylglycine-generating enzyme required for sulfatase activity